jgi:hypothetical protein
MRGWSSICSFLLPESLQSRVRLILQWRLSKHTEGVLCHALRSNWTLNPIIKRVQTQWLLNFWYFSHSCCKESLNTRINWMAITIQIEWRGLFIVIVVQKKQTEFIQMHLFTHPMNLETEVFAFFV